MIRFCRFFLLIAGSLCFAQSSLHGAGSTFAEPLYNKWGELFLAADGVKIEYDGVGSGEGVKRAAAHVVAFGGSDEPLKQDELDEKGLRQFPVAMGAIVTVVNLPGIRDAEFKLNADILSRIYLGKIKRWRDPAILELNSDIAKRIPDLEIKPVRRAESSGSTFVFTYYLNAMSPAWKQGPGVNKQMQNVAGITGNGSNGVVDLVKRTPGALSYVDFGRAKKDQLTLTQLPNRYGVFMQATSETIRAAARISAENSIYGRGQEFYMILTNTDTYDGWPLATATFVLLPKNKSPDVLRTLDFFNWSFKNGDAVARDLGYVPLPDLLKIGVRKVWSQVYGYKILQ